MELRVNIAKVKNINVPVEPHLPPAMQAEYTANVEDLVVAPPAAAAAEAERPAAAPAPVPARPSVKKLKAVAGRGQLMNPRSTPPQQLTSSMAAPVDNTAAIIAAVSAALLPVFREEIRQETASLDGQSQDAADMNHSSYVDVIPSFIGNTQAAAHPRPRGSL